MLAIFDLFDEWFHRQDFEGCAFINVMLRWAWRTRPEARACVISRTSAQWSVGLPRRPASRSSLVRALVRHTLMKGSIVQAVEGDLDAAARAKSMARLLIDEHR